MSSEALSEAQPPPQISNEPINDPPSIDSTLSPVSPLIHAESYTKISEPVVTLVVTETSAPKKSSTTAETPISPATAKKDRPKLVLAAWQPDDSVSECFLCKRSFTPLLLRFKVC
jgi:hypothetical protein